PAGLEDQTPFIEREVPLCILSAERELTDVAKMILPGKKRILSVRLLQVSRGRQQKSEENQESKPEDETGAGVRGCGVQKEA
ncbi:MAG: hypothetical protein IT282_13530, partial [Bacteroidetes bacterium]|nr:hypothetical protein [Bacteroidota bacterium]